MSWYLFGIVMAVVCFGMAVTFGNVALTKDPPLWLAVLLWVGVAAIARTGVGFIADMVRNDRRVRQMQGGWR